MSSQRTAPLVARSMAGQCAAELPLVREIFALFDADADGKLDKAEFKNYLQGSEYTSYCSCNRGI